MALAEPTGAQSGAPQLPILDLAKVYGDVYAAIRDTDLVSFKLMGFVPIVSGGGAAALSFLLTASSLGPTAIALLAFLGGISTFGIFRWELRNIQTCNRLWTRAEFLERRIGFGELSGRSTAPKLLGTPFGKTQAERLIYAASLGAWLVPIVLALT